MKIPFITWLLQGIPECLALAALILSIGTGRLVWRKIVLIGMIDAVVLYVVRLLPLTPYSHVIIMIPVLAFLAYKIGGIDLGLAHIISIISTFTIFTFEAVFMFIYSQVGFDKLMYSDSLVRAIGGLPQVVALFLLALLVCRLKKTLIVRDRLTRLKKKLPSGALIEGYCVENKWEKEGY